MLPPQRSWGGVGVLRRRRGNEHQLQGSGPLRPLRGHLPFAESAKGRNDEAKSHFLPCRAFSSVQKASTLLLSMILVGTMIRWLAGMKDLSPSRYFARSFMP